MPDWHTELWAGVGLFAFAAMAVYPFRGLTPEFAFVVGTSLAVVGALILLHSARLGKRSGWRWVATANPVRAPRRWATVGASILLMLAFATASIDWPTPTLKSSWGLALAIGSAFPLLIFVRWWAITR